ncbi:uncharacterized protein LOC112694187 isoform X2 [Sipha flava]|nr:uncharacterized protein LOC112694187 isoform X2 [Sipha flava]XP_025425387.1 uncharacterized protein LOC112694187 isoform X2 [Sipha flava]
MTRRTMTTAVCVLVVGVFAATTAGFGADDDGSADYNSYHGAEPSSGYGGGPNPKLPVILMHKQALQEDGGFQYAFAADNGLRQGESIRPDGSRTGAYSYTDPNGKEVSVKYTAGKDGFRIIQGDHVPKAPVSVVPVSPTGGGGAYTTHPSSGRSTGPAKNRLFGAPGGPGSQFSRGDFNTPSKYNYDDGESFGPPAPYKSKYSKPQQHYRVHEENSAELEGRYDDDGSSAYDGAVDYSSHSPFRAPPSPVQAAAYSGGASDNLQKNDESSNERQPHSFGRGYTFEFAGIPKNDGTSVEY